MFASMAATQSYIDDLEAGLVKPENRPVHAVVFADKAAAAAGEATVIVAHHQAANPVELLKAAKAALSKQVADAKLVERKSSDKPQ